MNTDALAGELDLLPMDSADAEILRDLLQRHVETTGSALAARMLEGFEQVVEEFVKVLPRNYAAVLAHARDRPTDEGLDPDGDAVWKRILEVTGG